jgi:Txe/YoeB family toxin of Txe-Axe toxin-antitoxin module
MKIAFTESAWQDYLWFQEHNRPLLKRLNDLIKDAQREPFRGVIALFPMRYAACCPGSTCALSS